MDKIHYEILGRAIYPLYPVYRSSTKDQKLLIAEMVGRFIVNSPKPNNMFTGYISKVGIELLKSSPDARLVPCHIWPTTTIGQFVLGYGGRIFEVEQLINFLPARFLWKYFLVTADEIIKIEEEDRHKTNRGRCNLLGIKLVQVDEEILNHPFMEKFKPLSEIDFYIL